MLLQSIGSNAEFVKKFGVTDRIKRIAIPNPNRQSGLIVNHSESDCLIEFGNYPTRLLTNPLLTLKVPARGGNLDIPPNYTGAIWVRWIRPSTLGYLTIHHYYFRKS
jgi:hypothetical protein